MRRKIIIIVFIVVMAAAVLTGNSQGRDWDSNKTDSFGLRLTGHVVAIAQKDFDSFSLEVEPLFVGTQEEFSGKNILITYRGVLTEPWKILHQDIEFFSVLERPSPARNPNCFDYRLYLQSKGIDFIGTIKNFTLKKSQEKNVFEIIDIELSKMRWNFQRKIPKEARGILMGILFGEKYYLDDETIEIFRENGTAHLLTVSGLHVGIFYSLYSALSKKHRQSKILKLIFAVVLLFYGALSSWSPSVVRAVAMILLSMAGECFDLRYDMLTALSLVTTVSVLRNPFVIYNPSFQMSCMAVISIAVIMPVLPKKIPESIRLCMAANIGLLLYQMYQFNFISLVAIVANIPMTLLIGYILPMSMVYFLLVSFASSVILAGISPIFEGFSIMLVKVNEWVNFGGIRGLDVVSPPLFLCLLIGAAIIFISSETFYLLKSKRKIKTIVLIAALFLGTGLMISESSKTPISEDDIVFIDVGQGDGIHIRAGDSNVLVDGGGAGEYLSYNVGRNTLKPYFLKNGVSKIDLAVVTHKHRDHYQGIMELEESFYIGKIKSELTAGDRIDMGKDIYIDVLWPLRIDDRRGQDDNSRCSVFMLNYDGIRVLITGDLDSEGEKQMLAHYGGTGKLRADVLKVGHHGSKSSTTDEFIDEVNPKCAVIQVGKNNYGHPSPLVIEKLVKKGIMVYRNDRDGAVGISVNDGTMVFHKMIG